MHVGYQLTVILQLQALSCCYSPCSEPVLDPNCIKGKGDLETRTLQYGFFDALDANSDFKVEPK